MSKYIKQEDAVRAVMAAKWVNGSDGAMAMEIIASQPAIDVTRCKDCAHYDLGVCLKIYSDGNAQKDSWQFRNSDDFAVTERERETILDYLQLKQEMRNLQKYKYYDIIFI